MIIMPSDARLQVQALPHTIVTVLGIKVYIMTMLTDCHFCYFLKISISNHFVVINDKP